MIATQEDRPGASDELSARLESMSAAEVRELGRANGATVGGQDDADAPEDLDETEGGDESATDDSPESVCDELDPGCALDDLDLADLTDDADDGDGGAEEVDVDELLRRVRAAVREEWLKLPRRRREAVRDALSQVDPLMASHGVRWHIAVRGAVYGWDDHAISAVVGISTSALRKWKTKAEFKAAVAQAKAEREAMRASLLSLVTDPPRDLTAQGRVDAIKRLERLGQAVLPRFAFQNDLDRADWLESL
jgi:hypothetical protein